ncbi:MAG TPA: hypothetical protein PKK26_00065 [Candidatus Wallbacteria bacterium]|nr:hypothetical protein [Candidatus Wallbacteria bacterium]
MMNQNNDFDPKIKGVFLNVSARRQNIDIDNIKSMQFKAITAKGPFVAKVIWLAAIILIVCLAYQSSNVSGSGFNKAGISDISVFEEQSPYQPGENKSAQSPDFIFWLAVFLTEGLVLFYIIKFIDSIATSILSRISHDRFKTIHFIC